MMGNTLARAAFLLLLSLAPIAGCTYPKTEVKAVDERPTLAIQGAPADAVLYVDGLAMGPATQYDGKEQVLLLEEGTHLIEIKRGGSVLYSEKAFLGSGATKTVTINPS